MTTKHIPEHLSGTAPGFSDPRSDTRSDTRYVPMGALASVHALSLASFPSHRAIALGIPALFVKTLEGAGLTRDDIRQIIPDRTLDRRIADGDNLKIEEADGIARLLRVVAFARRVFEDDVLADDWLRSANPALDGLVPMQMARTDLGGREVEAVLGRIEHGVFG